MPRWQPATGLTSHAYALWMALELRLLGSIDTRDGVPVPLSGRKPWGLLAYCSSSHVQRDVRRAPPHPRGETIHSPAPWLLHQVRRAIEPEGGSESTAVH